MLMPPAVKDAEMRAVFVSMEANNGLGGNANPPSLENILSGVVVSIISTTPGNAGCAFA
jgi:hypothetical protein